MQCNLCPKSRGKDFDFGLLTRILLLTYRRFFAKMVNDFYTGFYIYFSDILEKDVISGKS